MDRYYKMYGMRERGYSYREIGECFHVTRQRVHQILNRDGLPKPRSVLPRRKSLEEKFFGKVEWSHGCLVWSGAMTNKGYGRVSVDIPSVGGYAHRLAWYLEYGSIPQGMHVLHICDNPGCVNPKHLFLGTHSTNVRDRDLKGRGHSDRGKDGRFIEKTK